MPNKDGCGKELREGRKGRRNSEVGKIQSILQSHAGSMKSFDRISDMSVTRCYVFVQVKRSHCDIHFLDKHSLAII